MLAAFTQSLCQLARWSFWTAAWSLGCGGPAPVSFESSDTTNSSCNSERLETCTWGTARIFYSSVYAEVLWIIQKHFMNYFKTTCTIAFRKLSGIVASELLLECLLLYWRKRKSSLYVIHLLNIAKIIQILFYLQRYNDLEDYMNDADSFQEEKID